jgi:hypothetical protein
LNVVKKKFTREFLAAGGKISAPVSPAIGNTLVSQSFDASVMALRLPFTRNAMFRTTTLLIAMVLSGVPAASLVCELWCNSPAGDNHHRAVGCHDASDAAPSGQQIASTADCHGVVAMTPFVTEVRQTESASGAVVSPAHFQSESIGPDTGGATAGRSSFSVQPSRPASSRAVLRV